MDYKAVKTEFKANGEKGEYAGHFSVFGNVDDGGDISHPGSFAKTIQERGQRVKVFYAHDWEKLIGPPPEELKEDSVGLLARGRLTLGSFWGNEVWALMKDGALTEGSYGYEAVKFDYEEREGKLVRHLREQKLYEISPVPLGMNPLTDLRAVKAMFRAGQGKEQDEALGEFIAIVEEFSKDVKAGRVLSAANLEKAKNALGSLQAAIDALKSLLEAAEPSDGKQARAHYALLQKRVRAAEQALSLGVRL